MAKRTPTNQSWEHRMDWSKLAQIRLNLCSRASRLHQTWSKIQPISNFIFCLKNTRHQWYVPLICNQVTNQSDMGIFFKQAAGLSVQTPKSLITSSHARQSAKKSETLICLSPAQTSWQTQHSRQSRITGSSGQRENIITTFLEDGIVGEFIVLFPNTRDVSPTNRVWSN